LKIFLVEILEAKNDMHNDYNTDLPINLKLNIFITRFILLWESLAKTVIYISLISMLFIFLSVFNFFSILYYWLHIIFLSLFVIGYLLIIINLIRNFNWPSKISCIRRIEIDNNTEHRPLSTLFDKPGINVDNVLWKKHYNNMLEVCNTLGAVKSKSIYSNLDPLFIRLPILFLFFLTIYSFNNLVIDRVEAAILPQENNTRIANNGVFNGWVTPPEYTKKQPILLVESDKPLSIPFASVFSGRVFGGSGKSKLIFDDRIKDFIIIDDENSSIESIIQNNVEVKVQQNNSILFQKTILSIPDEIPKVDFLEKPQSTIKGILDIDFVFSDDYEVTKLYAKVNLKNPIATPNIGEINFNIPFNISDAFQTFGQYYHDLTEHPWAGLPVKISLIVEDYIGQKGSSEILEIILPEKEFKNLIALSVVNQRKKLALGKEKPFIVGEIIKEISLDSSFQEELILARDWLQESIVILMKDKEQQFLGTNDHKFVIDLLWKTALFIESGQLAIAENELRRAQQDLQEALSQGNEGKEIQDMVSNLDEALKKYLDELENPMDIDAPQVSESDNPGDRGGENGAQSNEEREDLEEKFEEIADLAVSGSLDEAQEQLDKMQDMTEAIDREALGEALGEDEGNSQPQAMQQISEMMQEQEALMEDSFEQSLNAAQADQKTPGSGPVNAGKKQEILRKQLEDVMHEIGESDNPIPEELGRAERAMRHAERELQRGRPDRAQNAQGRAIEELKKAAEKMDKIHSGDGPSQMAGNSSNNNNRDQRDPLGRVPPGQGNSPGGDIGLPKKQSTTRSKEIVKELYKKAEKSIEGSIERKYVDSLLDWY